MKKSKNLKLNESLLLLWGHISRKRKKQILMLVILILLGSFAEIISIGLVVPFLGVISSPERIFNHPYAKPLINLLSISKPNEMLFSIILIFMTVILIAGALRILILFVNNRLSFAVGSDLSIEIYHRILYQPFNVHMGRNSSELINLITKVNDVIDRILSPVVFMFTNSIMLFIISIAIFMMNPIVAISCFGGFGLIYFFINQVTKKKINQHSYIISNNSKQLIKCLQEGLGGIRDVLIDGSQETFIEIYKRSDVTLRCSQGNNQFIAQCPRFGIETLGMLLIAGLAYILSAKSGEVNNALPILATFAFAAQRLLPLMQTVYQNQSTIKSHQQILFDLVRLLEEPILRYSSKEKEKKLDFNKIIKFNGVSFKHQPNSNWILRNINLSVKKGSVVGFVGKTGSGKTTLLDILMGLQKPTTGYLSVDNIKVNKKNMRSWQKHIAHVPQSVYLSDATIQENIAFGISPDKIDFKLVRESAKRAQIDTTIMKWPDQYKTMVGERGVRLSGGQCQRIGIARALYKKADVIIFDEATSALDNKTEEDLNQSIKELSKEITIFIVAHRLSSLKNCNVVYDVSDNFKVKIF